MSIPDWLQRHLEATGRWNTDGVTRRTTSRVCRCGARILAGLDDDIAAWPTTVDPAPLDNAGELQALITGRRTYRLRHYLARGWQIDRRSNIDITAQPAGVVHVLVNHECGKPIPGNGPPIENPNPRRMLEEACPY